LSSLEGAVGAEVPPDVEAGVALLLPHATRKLEPRNARATTRGETVFIDAPIRLSDSLFR
jgi:hypothetical protein